MSGSLIRTQYLRPTEKTLTVEIVESAYQEMLSTVGARPPETMGMFAVDLDRPNRILSFRYCPPGRMADGTYDRSRGHINVDADYMNFVIDDEWRKRGWDLGGIAHSHPESFNRLTYGDETTNEGDVVFLRNCLRNDDSPGRRWKVCYAPIITFEAGGKPMVHWYAVTLDDPEPLPVIARIIPDASLARARNGAAPMAAPALPIRDFLNCHRAYQEEIMWVRQDETLDEEDRTLILDQLRELRRHDTSEKVRAMISPHAKDSEDGG